MTPGVRSSPLSRYRLLRYRGRRAALRFALTFTRPQVIYYAFRGWGVMYRMDVTTQGIRWDAPTSETVPALVVECTFRTPEDEPVRQFYPHKRTTEPVA